MMKLRSSLLHCWRRTNLAPHFSSTKSTRSSPAVIAGGHSRQSSPAVIAGGHRRRSSPAVLAGSRCRQSSPAVVAGGCQFTII